MRKFHTLLILFFLGIPLSAQSQNLNQTVERRVSAAQYSSKAQLDATRRAQAKQQTLPNSSVQQNAVQEGNTWYGLPIISWSTYKRESQQVIQTQEKYSQLYNEFLNSVDLKMLDINIKQGTPDYVKSLAHTKYIYIGEYHDTPVVQQKIKKMITTIRRANPGKKILLATEFLCITHPLTNPLHINGNEWVLSDCASYGINALADSLHLDTLALDDEIIQFKPTHLGTKTLVKAGNRYVMAGLDNQLSSYDGAAAELFDFAGDIVNANTLALKNAPANILYLRYLIPANVAQDYITQLHADKRYPSWKQEVAKQYGPGNEDYILYSSLAQENSIPIPLSYLKTIAKSQVFLNTLQASSWGALQRNYQWAKRIQAVEENYDIVIVWGGTGHFDDVDQYPSVPTLLAHPQAVQFDFIPLDADSIDENFVKGQLARAKTLQDRQLDFCSQIDLSQKQAEILVNSCQGFDSVDFEKTFFIMSKEQRTAQLSPQEEALLRQLQQLVPGVPTEDSFNEYYEVYIK